MLDWLLPVSLITSANAKHESHIVAFHPTFLLANFQHHGGEGNRCKCWLGCIWRGHNSPRCKYRSTVCLLHALKWRKIKYCTCTVTINEHCHNGYAELPGSAAVYLYNQHCISSSITYLRTTFCLKAVQGQEWQQKLLLDPIPPPAPICQHGATCSCTTILLVQDQVTP